MEFTSTHPVRCQQLREAPWRATPQMEISATKNCSAKRDPGAEGLQERALVRCSLVAVPFTTPHLPPPANGANQELLTMMKQMLDDTLATSLSKVATDMDAIKHELGNLTPTVTWLQEQVHDILVEESARDGKSRRKGETTSMKE